MPQTSNVTNVAIRLNNIGALGVFDDTLSKLVLTYGISDFPVFHVAHVQKPVYKTNTYRAC